MCIYRLGLYQDYRNFKPESVGSKSPSMSHRSLDFIWMTQSSFPDYSIPYRNTTLAKLQPTQHHRLRNLREMITNRIQQNHSMMQEWWKVFAHNHTEFVLNWSVTYRAGIQNYQKRLNMCLRCGRRFRTDPMLVFPSCASRPSRYLFPPLLRPTATSYHPLFYPLISPVPTSLILPSTLSESGGLPQMPPFTFGFQRALNTMTATLLKQPITNSLLPLVVTCIILVFKWSFYVYVYGYVLYEYMCDDVLLESPSASDAASLKVPLSLLIWLIYIDSDRRDAAQLCAKSLRNFIEVYRKILPAV